MVGRQAPAAPTGLNYVGGKAAQGSASNTAISLTDLTGGLSSSPSPGDIVIVALNRASGTDIDVALVTSGYTEVADLFASGSVYNTNFGVFYKIMGGSPDTSVTIPGNTAGCVAAIHVWRGVDQTTPMDVSATTATAGGGQPDPPAITPSTTGAVIIVAGAAAHATVSDFTSTLDHFQTISHDPGTAGVVGLGSVAWTSGSYNPPQWGGGSASGQAARASVTMALRPA